MTHPAAARRFRFGVVAPLLTDAATWRDELRRIADSGYDVLLVPDTPGWQPAPTVSLAVAASTTDLRVGSWVYAAPLRTARQLADEAHSLSLLTGGRFEFGVGAGRPGLADIVRHQGMTPTTVEQRWERVRESVAALRELDGPDLRTPVVVAARNAWGLAVARDLADTVNIAPRPTDTRADVAGVARDLLAHRDVEIALHVPVVGDAVAPFMTVPDTDAAALHAADSLLALPGDPAAAADEIRRRREEFGATYVVVGANAAAALAPAVAALAGT